MNSTPSHEVIHQCLQDKHLKAPLEVAAFDFVLCAAPEPVAPSAEFAEGLARLREQTGRRAHWLFATPEDGSWQPWRALRPLLEQLLQQAEQAAAPPQTRVLLLAHAQVLMADISLQCLHAGIAESAESNPAKTAAAWDLGACWSAAHPPPGLPPHYATLRGLERYVQLLRQAAVAQAFVLEQPFLPASVLAASTTVQAVRRWLQGAALAAAWLPGCFAHDFSAYHEGHEGRREMLRWIPPKTQRVLDVGGGEGHFLALLRAKRGCETHLSEFSTTACALAAPYVDYVWPGDFLQCQPTHLAAAGQGAFDCITFLDSLEHSSEPGLWLDKAYELLGADGYIVGSIPNVGHWSVVADLLEGRWDYCPVGIHCNTHLRFFTRRTIENLLARHGFAIEIIEPTLVPAPQQWRQHWLATPTLDTSAAELDAYAFVFRARKISRS